MKKSTLAKLSLIASALVLSNMAIAESSRWLHNSDPGSHVSKDSTIGGWDVSSHGAKSTEIIDKGQFHLCNNPGKTCPSQSYAQADAITWAYATAVSLAAKVGVKAFGDVTATITQTVTYGTSKTYTNTSNSPVVKHGQSVQFMSLMPRREAAKGVHGVMVDTGKSKPHMSCTRGGCGPVTGATLYYYEWKPSEYAATLVGKPAQKTEPVWTWVIDGKIPSV